MQQDKMSLKIIFFNYWINHIIKRISVEFLSEMRLNNSDIFLINQNIWNVQKHIKRKKLSKYTSTQILLQQLYRKRWYVKMTLKNIKKIKMLFFVDKNIINILRKNFEIFVINCIYKTNRFNMFLLNIVDHIFIETTFYIDFAFINKKRENRYVWIFDQFKTLFKNLNIRDFLLLSLI